MGSWYWTSQVGDEICQDSVRTSIEVDRAGENVVDLWAEQAGVAVDSLRISDVAQDLP